MFMCFKEKENECVAYRLKLRNTNKVGHNEIICLINISNYIPITKIHCVNEDNYTASKLGKELITKYILEFDKYSTCFYLNFAVDILAQIGSSLERSLGWHLPDLLKKISHFPANLGCSSDL